MLERRDTEFSITHEAARWAAHWDRTRFGGDQTILFHGEEICRDFTLYLDDVGPDAAASVANRAFRRGGAAVVEEEAVLPGDPGMYVHRTWRYAANHVRVTADVGWPRERSVQRHFGVDGLFLPGVWRRMAFLPPAPVRSGAPWELRMIDLPPAPESGGLMVMHTHRPPPVLVFIRRGGARVEIGTGADLWRWEDALGAGPENGNWKVLLSAEGLRIVREPLTTCTGFAPAARPYRFTWYAAWAGTRRPKRSHDRSLFPLAVTPDGKIPNLKDVPLTPIPKIYVDFSVFNAHAAWRRAPSMARTIRGERIDAPCWSAAPIRNRARAVIRRIAAGLPPGKLEIAGLAPGVCWDPAHLRRRDPDGLPHWDLWAILEFAVWTRRTLGPRWSIVPIIPPPWDELPSLRGLFGPNGFEGVTEAAETAEVPDDEADVAATEGDAP